MAREVSKVNEDQDRVLDELLKGKTPEQILGESELIKQMTKRMVERALQAELTAHLGYDPHEKAESVRDNSRNGTGTKAVLTGTGALPIEVPRDRAGGFEPRLIRKRQRRLQGFDDKVISLYARGLTTCEIQGHLEELYGTEVSPTLISAVTESVIDDLKAWQGRPLDAVYPIIYLDALFVKSRQEGPVVARAVYLALAINLAGEKKLLGLWVAKTEGAKFWLNVLTELKNRGLRDCVVAVYPQTQVQLCVVHKIRQSLNTCRGRNGRAWPPISRPSTAPPYSRTRRPRSRASAWPGTASTRPSPRPGAPTGPNSPRSLIILRTSAR